MEQFIYDAFLIQKPTLNRYLLERQARGVSFGYHQPFELKLKYMMNCI